MSDTTATDWITPDMKVVIYDHDGSSTATVLRLTPTQIVLRTSHGNEARYRRDNGRKAGDHYGGGELRPTTDPAWLKQLRARREAAARDRVRAAADNLKFKTGAEGRAGLLALQDEITKALAVFDEAA